MLVLRLQRTGRKNLPTYRLVVAEKSHAVKGKPLEIIGHYLPAREKTVFEFDTERITHWVSKGAHPSDTVARLLKRNGVNGMEKFIQRYTKQKEKNPSEEVVAPAAAPAPTPAPAAEAPAAEAPAA